MPEPSSPPIVFPCPCCKRFVATNRDESSAVRRLGRRKSDPLIVRMNCPICLRLIVRTFLGESDDRRKR